MDGATNLRVLLLWISIAFPRCMVETAYSKGTQTDAARQPQVSDIRWLVGDWRVTKKVGVWNGKGDAGRGYVIGDLKVRMAAPKDRVLRISYPYSYWVSKAFAITGTVDEYIFVRTDGGPWKGRFGVETWLKGHETQAAKSFAELHGKKSLTVGRRRILHHELPEFTLTLKDNGQLEVRFQNEKVATAPATLIYQRMPPEGKQPSKAKASVSRSSAGRSTCRMRLTARMRGGGPIRRRDKFGQRARQARSACR